MNGRDGFSNAELVAMFPTVPEETCDGCGERGLCAWNVFARKYCGACQERRGLTSGGTQ